MAETCPRCGRQKCASWGRPFSIAMSTECGGPADDSCAAIVDAYRRGLREGVEVAKRLAWADDDSGPDDDAHDLWIDWTDVNAEIARLTGGDR